MTIYTDITQHIHLPAEVATITNRLVETFHPERVYLFGSVARGDATADSDLDFMVVVADSSLPQYRRSQEAQRALFAIKQAKDVLVWTREEFDSRLHLRASLPATIIREGVLLYGARSG